MEGCFDRNRLKKISLCIIGCCVMIVAVFLPLLVILILGMQDGDTGMTVTAAVLMAVLAGETIMIIMLRKRAARARRYATIFEEDHDGIITYERINEMTSYQCMNWIAENSNRLQRGLRVASVKRTNVKDTVFSIMVKY